MLLKPLLTCKKRRWIANSAKKQSDISDSIIREETRSYNARLLSAQKDVLNETKSDAEKKDRRDAMLFKENKKQFEIENSPFLEIINAVIDPVVKSKPVVIRFAYFNHGKLPAHVTIQKSKIEYSYSDNAIENTNNKYAQTKINFYIANGVSQGFTAQIDSLKPDIVDDYNNGLDAIFLSGSCDYINPVTKKKFAFYFRHRFKTKPIPSIEAIKDTVVEIK